MPAKEIKELRVSGKINEAYDLALTELQADSNNVWTKRNMSWVLYAQLDLLVADLNLFLLKIEEVKSLNLPDSEEMFFDNLSIVIGKAARAISSHVPMDNIKLFSLFDSIKILPLKRKSKWFTFLFTSFHKGMKETERYIEFADWWDFSNFREEDFLKETMQNGKEIMAVVEQAYIAYAKKILEGERHDFDIMKNVNKDKIYEFMPKLDVIVENHPEYQYPPYFKAKLLLALGDNENMLSALLPFAKKKKNDFWVWDTLSEAFRNDEEKVVACYCKALSCKSPEEMLVNLRQRMAAIFIKKQLFNEAKTEINLLVKSKTTHGFKIPYNVADWMNQDWYKKATSKTSNVDFYKNHIDAAEGLLFSDIPEENIIVEFVNSDRKILNFIASETKFGFLKYERFLKDVKVGDVLKVRFQSYSAEAASKVYTLALTTDDNFKNQFIKEIEGDARIQEGKSFGFIHNTFLHPSIVSRNKITNGMHIKGIAMKTFNAEKKQWGWKLI